MPAKPPSSALTPPGDGEKDKDKDNYCVAAHRIQEGELARRLARWYVRSERVTYFL